MIALLQVTPLHIVCHTCTATQAGSHYDNQVVYRMVAMWFSLSNDRTANAQFASHFKELPSHKFVPLVYQARVLLCSS